MSVWSAWKCWERIRIFHTLKLERYNLLYLSFLSRCWTKNTFKNKEKKFLPKKGWWEVEKKFHEKIASLPSCCFAFGVSFRLDVNAAFIIGRIRVRVRCDYCIVLCQKVILLEFELLCLFWKNSKEPKFCAVEIAINLKKTTVIQEIGFQRYWRKNYMTDSNYRLEQFRSLMWMWKPIVYSIMCKGKKY